MKNGNSLRIRAFGIDFTATGWIAISVGAVTVVALALIMAGT
jgi:hypothetical protein